MALADVVAADGVERGGAAGRRRRARGRLGAPDRAGDRRGRARARRAPSPSRRSSTARASASRAWSAGAASQVGRPSLLAEWSLRDPRGARRRAARRRGRRAAPRSLVAWDGEVRGLLAVADTVKPTSAEAVARLHALGLRTVLLTGDNEATARAVAAEVGIDEVIAEVLPAEQGRRDPAAAGRRPRGGDGRRRRQRRARARRRPTSAWRSAPAPTSRSRPPT